MSNRYREYITKEVTEEAFYNDPRPYVRALIHYDTTDKHDPTLVSRETVVGCFSNFWRAEYVFKYRQTLLVQQLNDMYNHRFVSNVSLERAPLFMNFEDIDYVDLRAIE